MTSWTRAGTAGSYEVWKRDDGGRALYNVSKDGAEPGSSGGYYHLRSLLTMKGLTEADFEPAAALSGPRR